MTSSQQIATASDTIATLLGSFRLPTAAREMATRLVDAGWEGALPVVCEVLESEHEDRHERRVERLRRASRLPGSKTFATLDQQRLPLALQRQLRELTAGDFLDQAANVLAFGLPGTGKTHAACALGHAMVEAGRSVLFAPTHQIVQQLLAAKRDLELPRALARLDGFDLLILDDIGYVQQDAHEVEVLFTLLAERYERRSVVITSNLMFSQWDRIFKNPMTTAAAIDRLVHHAVILEFDVSSYRTRGKEHGSGPSVAETDSKRSKSKKKNEPATTQEAGAA
jgi:DNA replication protein DnaC